MTKIPAENSDEKFSQFQVHFREEQIVELVATIAMENCRARFNWAFLSDAQEIYKPNS